MKKKKWALFEHTADLGLYIYGRDRRELYEAAAGALMAQITAPEKIRPARERIVELSADSPEALLRDWMAEILYLCNALGWLTAEAGIESLTGNTLKAVLRGEALDSQRHEIGAEIKAVTWHRLKIEKLEPEGILRATVVLDV
ncbi:MAG: hypothetical protein A3F83_05105 [Candidatus Glassbacteria bacterium RIFCSPLOWO2_12_FULL_58_11]|uniref:Archease domain-containing protein n=1 Tax=Candidatus Glassbacteria bacterium RIFCSPLOWO2_12_FULL_58_11 TaxID=1817867 RepID=A0A1F5Z188_9BACT|nr:MAG: hypothetical protein A3F83_05105 [Candidatus Glassbacteria bacterium RIFCSPLOWO2_12_FULL_58_11]